MHFTVLYVMKNEKLDNVSPLLISEDFSNRYCYNCGETKAKNVDYCDWFIIGGRWNDILTATRGYHGEESFGSKPENFSHKYSVVEIKDLANNIDPSYIHAIATKTKILEDRREVEEYCNLINNRQIKGVIALIDCHD